MSLLARIVAQKRAELAAGSAVDRDPRVAALRGRSSGATRSSGSPPALPGAVALLERPAGGSLRLITEVKFSSPSAGLLSRKLDAGERAVAYAKAGATMVSVLCDATFFGGAFGDLADARAALDRAGLPVPLLAKEFVLDPVQLGWARDAGASVALLIARLVDAPSLGRLVAHARALGLEPLVEVTTDAERDTALAAGARVVGVNARDLDTLAMDPARAARVLAGVPAGVVAVHLSGLATADAVRAVARGRADAALVGEALMREDDPAPLLRDFVSAASSA